MTLKTIQFICLAAFLLLGVSCASVTAVKVEGVAMLPTFKDGDRLMVRKDAGEIERLDVIIFRYPKDPSKSYIKRVIGLPDETIAIAGGKVIIDGKELAEPYVDPGYNQSTSDLPPFKVPPDHYFVLGDNRDNSSDSRYWGTVDKELIVGKCFVSY